MFAQRKARGGRGYTAGGRGPACGWVRVPLAFAGPAGGHPGAGRGRPIGHQPIRGVPRDINKTSTRL
eukprot:247953-Prorocentrum_minimum.AAC.3